ncbi:trans-resveratrol di-O-methyltransferase-like [Malania oleifera]|uniref:trans-resveratrol di-O-methyltransferase-like n=1 Tax=Malania oleifera TaxID=397392 RepID=UPI0025AE4F8B|nr:trans-resveratrol di-O-methyltransferase-like [Malania oleifera]
MEFAKGDLHNERASTTDDHEDLLKSQAHIWNHIFNFINSMSLKCAIQLGIPDAIHRHGGGPMALHQLVMELRVPPARAPDLARLMRLLVHSSFFASAKCRINGHEEEEEEEGYVLTAASRLLLKDDPMSVTPLVLAMLDPVLTEPWHMLAAWFQNDVPSPFQEAHGKPFWEYGKMSGGGLNKLFNEAMASDTRLVGRVVVSECRGVFEGMKSVVDVAGGTGALAMAIARAFPAVRCTVLDQPHVVEGLQAQQQQWCENLHFLGGDMFEAIPPADAVLLKWILHDWNDDESVKILKRCKEAIPSKEKGGKVIIIDMILIDQSQQKGRLSSSNDDNDDEQSQSVETQLFFDMVVMALYPGKERTEKEWAKLFCDAGFSDYKITPVLGLRSLIEVYP